ncbi:MAG TPA: VCBS repeat-containing protein [Planctomycetaceae bacterium]|nr:VCBS repeat-containing protein [Planctomycetaceae bacterium]
MLPCRDNSIAVLLKVAMLCGLASLGCSSNRDASNGDSALVGEAKIGEPLELFTTVPIGASFDRLPRISHLVSTDFDQDGQPDVIVCDCTKNTVSILRRSTTTEAESSTEPEYTEQVILDGIVAPARVEVVDFDADGDQDLFVAVLGKLNPSNDPIGSLIALENIAGDGGGDGDRDVASDEKTFSFRRHDVLVDVARVSDVRAGDLDGDGDRDLVVTQFGYYDGGLQWLENQGDWQFAPHALCDLAGGIHGEIADMNGDGFADIVLLLSQEIEELRIFYGDGKGQFEQSTAWSANNPDFGSSGCWTVDLDLDGDMDVLYANGDAFDYSPPRPWPWHGLQWLENVGDRKFKYHRLVELGGAVNMHAADYDQDGDLDIFATSTFNDWSSPESSSLIVLENTDNMQFVSHRLANSPTHIQALDVGDFDSDGSIDLITGGMHVFEPNDRVERVLLWQGISR